jgi:predicted amidohydrolase
MKSFLSLLLLALSLTTALANGSSFVIGVLRVTPDRWDKEANFKKLEHYARLAKSRGAQLVVTPESFLDGYVSNDSDLDRNRYQNIGEPVDGPIMRRVARLAAELKIYLLIGYPERRGDHMYNSVVIFGPDGAVVTRYSKTHCGSERYNAEGTEFPVVNTPLGRWGTLICPDRQLPETSRILAIKGAQLILVPSYGMHGEMNDVMMRTRAYENGVYVAFVHPQRCLIVNPKGAVIAKDDGAGDELITARIDLDERVGRGPIQSRRPEIYAEILTRR